MLPHNIPLTGLMTSFVALMMMISWLYVTMQIRHSQSVPQRSVVFLNRYFLNMALFCVCLSVPYIWLATSQFGLAMALGYVIGHVFCYVAFMHITRMVFALQPRLASKDRWVVAFWLAAAIVVTIANAKTMIWGTRPIFDHAHNLTEFNTATPVGAAIGVLSAAAIIPALVLFIRSAIKAQGIAKIKPLLLTAGFLIVMVAGPMHDVARSGAVYATADFLSAVSMFVLCIGVVYRIEHRLDEAPGIQPMVHAASNTL